MYKYYVQSKSDILFIPAMVQCQLMSLNLQCMFFTLNKSLVVLRMSQHCLPEKRVFAAASYVNKLLEAQDLK